MQTGIYICEFCGKQYKYFNPYQEHVALHAPLSHSFEMQSPRAQQRAKDTKSTFNRKMDNKLQSSLGETNSSQNSSGTMSPMVSSSFPPLQTDNENHTPAGSTKSSPAPAAQERLWKSLSPSQRSSTANLTSALPEKERQQVAERLLRVMCADLGALNVLSGKDFLKLAQALVDTGARHGAYPLRDALGDVSSLALRQLPRMYNQAKVKVTCALGSSASPGIAITCHAQTGGAQPCYALTAHQVDGVQLRRYVLGVCELDLRDGDGDGEGDERVQQWVQNVLSEFVMPEVRAAYVTEPRRPWAAPSCGRAGTCLRCTGCSLGAVVQAVLGRKSLQTRGLHEIAELLASCHEVAGAVRLPWDGPGGAEDHALSPAPAPPPPCWDQTTETLLKVHEHFEQICQVYGTGKAIAPLNKHLLGTLAALLAPVRQAAVELSSDHRPTLQLVLPAYLRLEKLFTAKASEAGAGSKLCHYFLEALKENFKVEHAHQVAMVLDPQLKLRPVPSYQHDDIIAKRGRLEGRAGPQEVRKEVFQYLSEPLFQAVPNLFQYWGSVMERYPRLARLALWLLAVPAVGVRAELAAACEQAVAMRGQQPVSADDMNKLIFLKSNVA
ncbi:hypothetical protein SKAU_G00282160 [Synaphobranchus kaupii]|uniref:C2H2-type domain-containing protein n=1 Tax=Synaphobranchus kaupii TaxID=118154 RepID=A0A9Q1EXC2_SYNKA|nr:hypothetical protein SKAU_G00282160 [Synaphobranchus kaupii]